MERTVRRALAVLGATLAGGVLVGGCASAERPEVERVAAQFEAGDAAARCALLSPAAAAAVETGGAAPCAVAMGRMEVPAGAPVSTEVWGDEAQVRTADDVLFLTRTEGGWRVSAAGCRSRGELPYDCLVEGP